MKISEENSSAFITGINLASIMCMPLAVFAFVYLLVAKRRKDADAKKVAEYIASREESEKEDNEDTMNGDNLYSDVSSKGESEE